MMPFWGVLFNGLLKCAQCLVPHLVKMGAKARHAVRIQLIKPASSIPDVGHETRMFQHSKVLRNCRARYGHGTRKFIDCDGSAGQFLEYCHARGIGERIDTGL
jgi:hypothetical protein